MRRRDDERHDDGRLDRRRHVRFRPLSRRRRAHGPPHPIGANADPNPRFVRREDGRPRRRSTWASRGAHLRSLPAPDQGALGPLRHAEPAQGAGSVRRRQDPARPRSRGHQGARRRLGSRHRRRGPSPADHHGGPRGPQDAVPPARPRHRRHLFALTDGATMSLLAGGGAVEEFGLAPKMRMVSFAFAGVQPEIMGIGPIRRPRRP